MVSALDAGLSFCALASWPASPKGHSTVDCKYIIKDRRHDASWNRSTTEHGYIISIATQSTVQ